MTIHPAATLQKLNLMMLAALKPLGIWGIGGLAILDSAIIPMPLDPLVIDYVAHDHARFILYCLMAAAGSAIGSLLPFLIGRAGGELFLLKRINRQRYEKLRDRFEKQEFLAIVIPAMMPPPFPVKLFEFAAGVFEMKLVWFLTAIFVGKFIRFLVWAIITIVWGPALLHSITRAFHQHLGIVLAFLGVIAVGLAAYVVRRLFDRRRGTSFPVEEDEIA